MFENFKNLFNSKDTNEEELFPYDDSSETSITPEMFDDDLVIQLAAKTSLSYAGA